MTIHKYKVRLDKPKENLSSIIFIRTERGENSHVFNVNLIVHPL